MSLKQSLARDLDESQSGNDGAHAPGPASAGAGAETAAASTTAVVQDHLRNVLPALASLRYGAGQLAAWGEELAVRLLAGNRLLVAGNGGSAAQAQHLSAELVGRFDGERRAFSAIALHVDTSAVTAIGNDYGFEEIFARQVRAHARPGDVLILLSTSGRSPNLLRAAAAARHAGIASWALTGTAPSPLALAVDEFIAVEAPSANVQEAHLIALHAICRSFDATIARREGRS